MSGDERWDTGGFQSCLARVLDSAGRPVGAAFLVGPRHLITCTHVVDAVFRESTDQVLVDFPLASPRTIVRARVAVSWPQLSDLTGDITGLIVSSALPSGVAPTPLSVAYDLWGHGFRALGFPEGFDGGVWAHGVLRGPTASGWIQLEGVGHTGIRLQPGFSGTAVWDEKVGAVIGMLVAVANDSGTRTGFLIPSGLLLQAWPELESHALPASPYRGLSAFREQDDSVFFGRSGLVDVLFANTRSRPLTALVGPSGCGKSSVIFAGLVPRVRSDSWSVISMRPGSATTPLAALASSFLPVLEPEVDAIAQIRKIRELESVLLERPAEVAETARLRSGGSHLLIIIDQFEELYGLHGNVSEPFLDVLLKILDVPSPDPRIHVLLTMRSDHLDQLLSQPALAAVLTDTIIPIGEMAREQLQEVIEGPLRPNMIESGLTSRILDDVGLEPGTLPLLEFALTLLWEARSAGILTHAAYGKIGGARGALARYAESVWTDQLSGSDHEVARRVLIQLVRPGIDGRHMRRNARRDEFDQESWKLAQRLALTRLVVAGRDETGHEILELTHESLIVEWRRLYDWVESDREFRTWQEMLRLDIDQWGRSSRDVGALLRGRPLAESESWQTARGADLNSVETDFIELSRRHQNRGIRRLRMLVAALTTLLLVAAMLGVLTYNQNQVAQAEARDARTRFLVSMAEANLTSRPDLSMLLSLQADETASTPQTRASLLAQSMLRRGIEAYFNRHTSAARSLAVHPDGKLFISGSDDGKVIFWGIPDRSYVGERDLESPVTTVRFSGDGTVAAAATRKGDIVSWRISDTLEPISVINTGDVVEDFVLSDDGKDVYFTYQNAVASWNLEKTGSPRILTGDGSKLISLALSGSGLLAAGGSERETVVWDTRSSKRLAVLEQPETGSPVGTRFISALAFTPDSGILVTGTQGGDLTFWSMPDGEHLRSLELHNDSITSMAFDSAGEKLATSGEDGRIVLWAITNLDPYAVLTGHADSALAVAFDPQGKSLISGGNDGNIILWRLDRHAILMHEDDINDIAFSPDGSLYATASQDNTVALWGVAADRPTFILRGHKKNSLFTETGAVSSVTFSPDGKRLVTGGLDGRIIVWSVSTGDALDERAIDGQVVLQTRFLPDGRLAVVNGRADVQVWDAELRDHVDLDDGDVDAYKIAVDPSGRLLAQGNGDGSVILWDMRTYKQLATMRAHTSTVASMAFDPRGRLLATTGDRTVALFDVARRALHRTLTGHTGETGGVAFSPDGSTVLSGGADNQIIMWDAETGFQVNKVSPGHPEWLPDIFALAFSPDGRTFVSGGVDRAIIRWPVDHAKARQTLCALTTRELTVAEREFFQLGQSYRNPCGKPTVSKSD